MKNIRLEEAFETFATADIEAREALERAATAKFTLTQSVLDAGLVDCVTLNVDKLARVLRVAPPRRRN